ncbi:MAG: cation:proton antiporter [Prosthecochloris sp.]|uniref:Sodium/hydrogen exchanger n=1 Tax=Prosthecochloris aestuarii (strain DSM 271 / SK 413) TaxID=290512 RepID=B4S9C2_PROA2|nr:MULTISPECIES: cation:proton antiporter [Prosthecochloris]ACF46592.1 sodium/hydrogen exchanger [Prosthecochloris aestuarii DSM 271]MCW8798341.1 cation:proton antiporter [Prosthecochloris sp.]
MEVSLFAALIGGIIVLGVVGDFLFAKSKIPTPVILMLAGIILGPVTNIFTSDIFFEIAPYFGTFALILILFEGGLDLEFDLVIRQFSSALLLGFLSFILSCAGITAVCLIQLQMDMSQALLYGFIFSGTSPAVILPILSRLSITKNLKTLLTLEAVISEVLTVISVIIMINILREPGHFDPRLIVQHISASIGISIVLALLSGIIWSRFMGYFSRQNLAYMLTLGVVLLLYTLTAFLGGEPAITVLAFGILLGNGKHLATKTQNLMARMNSTINVTNFELDEVVKKINAELTFLVRTFFFVFIGLLFNFTLFTPNVLSTAGTILAIFLISRYATVTMVRPLSPSLRSAHTSSTLGLIPRGLATAVMAFLVIDAKITPSDQLLPVVFSVILGSNLLMSGFVYYYQSRHSNREEQEKSA